MIREWTIKCARMVTLLFGVMFLADGTGPWVSVGGGLIAVFVLLLDVRDRHEG